MNLVVKIKKSPMWVMFYVVCEAICYLLGGGGGGIRLGGAGGPLGL